MAQSYVHPLVARRNERVERIRAWLHSLHFGATKKQITTHFAEYYPNPAKHSADERRYHRDIKYALALGGLSVVNGKIIRSDSARAITP